MQKQRLRISYVKGLDLRFTGCKQQIVNGIKFIKIDYLIKG